MDSFQIRNLEFSDLDHLCAVFGRMGLRDFISDLKRPGYSVDKDFFIAIHKGEIVGFSDVILEKNIGRSLIDLFVLPAYRRKGFGRALLSAAVERAVRYRSHWAHIRIDESHQEGKDFLLRGGFQKIRCFIEMHMEVSSSCIGLSSSAFKPGIRPLKKGEEARLLSLQNRIFKGSWGFCPNSIEEFLYYMERTRTRIEDILVLENNSKMVGYIWPHKLSNKINMHSEKRERIHMFGIHPSYQRMGWGEKILSVLLHQMKERGTKSVELTVDENNWTALSIYRKAGFREYARTLWFERKI
jgi:mycothiol synthase